MRCLTKIIEYSSREERFTLVPLSDEHLGNGATEEEQLADTIEAIRANERGLWVGMGDLGEFINTKDKRFDADSLAPWCAAKARDIGKAQREKIVELHKPIAGQCLALVEGNHEREIRKHADCDVYTTVAEGLGLKDVCLGASGFLRLVFRRRAETGHKCDTWTMVVYLHHGWWGGRGEGAGATNLERVCGEVDADLILIGHDHKSKALAVNRSGCTHGNKIYTHTIHAASCATFCGRPLYGEEKGYRASVTGAIQVDIWPDKRELRVRV
jgi:hypothetical protein